MNIRSKLSSKILFLGFIIAYVAFFSFILPLYFIMMNEMDATDWHPFSLMGSSFVYALLIGGVPFIIYHFIIGDRKKKKTSQDKT